MRLSNLQVALLLILALIAGVGYLAIDGRARQRELEVEIKRLKFHHEMLAEGYSCISLSDSGSLWIRPHFATEPDSISVQVSTETRTAGTDTIYVPDASVKHSGGAVQIRLK